jgi:hypothetical protein
LAGGESAAFFHNSDFGFPWPPGWYTSSSQRLR